MSKSIHLRNILLMLVLLLSMQISLVKVQAQVPSSAEEEASRPVRLFAPSIHKVDASVSEAGDEQSDVRLWHDRPDSALELVRV